MALDLNLLRDVHGRHPARQMSFDDLRDGLRRAVEGGAVTVSREGGLELYAYTNACRFEGLWDVFSLVARGLVLDAPARRVAATPFPKFFNFNERGGVNLSAGDLPREPFEVTEKVDGSLGIVFHHAGRWRVTTWGNLASEQGRWATDFLHRRATPSALTPGTTYLVEIVSPRNRIVIPYAHEALVLLTAYDEAGDELPRAGLEAAGAAAGLPVVGRRAYDSFDDLVAVARSLPRTEEGFVVRFAGGVRVKIKGEAYCRAHRMMCDCSPLGLWEAMMNGEDLDRRRRELPEEVTADFDAIRSALGRRLDELLAGVRAAVGATAHLSDKDLGRLIQEDPCPFPPPVRRLVFRCRKGNFLDGVGRPGEARRQAFRYIRPDRNELPGYTPSDTMTRFGAENE